MDYTLAVQVVQVNVYIYLILGEKSVQINKMYINYLIVKGIGFNLNQLEPPTLPRV